MSGILGFANQTVENGLVNKRTDNSRWRKDPRSNSKKSKKPTTKPKKTKESNPSERIPFGIQMITEGKVTKPLPEGVTLAPRPTKSWRSHPSIQQLKQFQQKKPPPFSSTKRPKSSNSRPQQKQPAKKQVRFANKKPSTRPFNRPPTRQTSSKRKRSDRAPTRKRPKTKAPTNKAIFFTPNERRLLNTDHTVWIRDLDKQLPPNIAGQIDSYDQSSSNSNSAFPERRKALEKRIRANEARQKQGFNKLEKKMRIYADINNRALKEQIYKVTQVISYFLL